MPTSSFKNDKGAALIEFCIILPVLLLLVFAIIDFGRLILARLIITNVTREGGSLASRDIKSGTDLIAMLQSSASPLNLGSSGLICISNIEAGTITRTAPIISVTPISKRQVCGGSPVAASSINAGATNLGLTGVMYNHLVFKQANQASDINGVTVVETFYRFTPITPLPNFITNLWTGGSTIIGSRAVFCATTGELP
jgi:hypothetical protein